MTNEELQVKVEKAEELNNEIKKLQEELDNCKEQIKSEFKARNIVEMILGKFTVKVADVVSNRFDSSSFKKEYKDLYESFTKASSSVRLTITENKEVETE